MRLSPLAIAVTAIVPLGTLTACDAKGGTPTVTVAPSVGVISVTVSPPSVALRVGERTTLVASVAAGTTVTDRTVTWSSSDSKIATVVANGVVRGESPGTTTVRAVAKANASVVGAVAVTVVGDTTSGVTIQPLQSPTPAQSPAVTAGSTPVPPLTLQPVRASFEERAKATTYVVAYTKTGSQPLSFTWSGLDCGDPRSAQGTVANAAGEFTFQWNHDHPPCDATTNHANVTIVLTVEDANYVSVCRYPGAATGSGAPCTTTRKTIRPVAAGGFGSSGARAQRMESR